MNIGANLGAGLSQGYAESAYSGGSTNSAQSYNNAFNNSFNEGWSNSASGTYADEARMWSAYMADIAWQRDMEALQKQMDFNAAEAQKQRDWQTQMANTIYTRSVKNMKKAGINPILAANMGLSGASVGSGATASIGGVPSAPLAQNFMDSWSASESYSHGSGYGESEGSSWGSGSSWNNGWSNSEEGIVTALQALGDMSATALAGIASGKTLENMSQELGNSKVTDWGYNIGKNINNYVKEGINNIGEAISDKISSLTSRGGGHGFGNSKKMKHA